MKEFLKKILLFVIVGIIVGTIMGYVTPNETIKNVLTEKQNSIVSLADDKKIQNSFLEDLDLDTAKELNIDIDSTNSTLQARNSIVIAPIEPVEMGAVKNAKIEYDIEATTDNLDLYKDFSSVVAEDEASVSAAIDPIAIVDTPIVQDDTTEEKFIVGNAYATVVAVDKTKLDDTQLNELKTFKQAVLINTNKDYGVNPVVAESSKMLLVSNVRLDKKQLTLSYPDKFKSTGLANTTKTNEYSSMSSTVETDPFNLVEKCEYVDDLFSSYIFSSSEVESINMNKMTFSSGPGWWQIDNGDGTGEGYVVFPAI